MVTRFLMSGLLVLSMFAILEAKANAGTTCVQNVICPNWVQPAITTTQICTKCTTSTGGTPLVTYVVTGTTEVWIQASGLGGLECTKKGSTAECPEFKGTIYGTIENPNDTGTTCTPTEFDAECLISVRGVCGPEKCIADPSRPGCQNMDFKSAHFAFEDIPFEIEALACEKNGSCKDSLVYFEASDQFVCKPGHNLISVFADKFNLDGVLCPVGGFDSQGNCCTSADKVADVCQAFTATLKVEEYCEVSGNNPQQGAGYTCCEFLGGTDPTCHPL